MGSSLYIIILVVTLVVVVVLALWMASARRKAQAVDPRRPQGYYVSLGLALGLVAGSALAVLLQALTEGVLPYMAIGPAMGMPFGLAVGSALEQRHKNKLRPLSEQEGRIKQVSLWVALVGAALLLAGILVLVFAR